jgi:hypothetical protein
MERIVKITGMAPGLVPRPHSARPARQICVEARSSYAAYYSIIAQRYCRDTVCTYSIVLLIS